MGGPHPLGGWAPPIWWVVPCCVWALVVYGGPVGGPLLCMIGLPFCMLGPLLCMLGPCWWALVLYARWVGQGWAPWALLDPVVGPCCGGALWALLWNGPCWALLWVGPDGPCCGWALLGPVVGGPCWALLWVGPVVSHPCLALLCMRPVGPCCVCALLDRVVYALGGWALVGPVGGLCCVCADG